MSFWEYRDYVSVAQRRANALREIEKLKKKGRVISPVAVEGRKIAKSFWGKMWCDNLERYSDYANRLPRGRTYVNNGSVIDLQIGRGAVEALVSGSEIYKVKINIAVAAAARWKAICADCAGSVGSIVELLQGKLSKHVMERVCRDGDGLFPTPTEIEMSCSCPDWADMCKHVAATLYGVGARLDSDPDLLFTLRGVNRSELVSTGADLSIIEAGASSERVLAGDDLAALFGLEIETPVAPTKASRRQAKGRPLDVRTQPPVDVRKSKVNERRGFARMKAANERPAPNASEKKSALTVGARPAGGKAAKARRFGAGIERVAKVKPGATAGTSGDRGTASAATAAKSSASKPKASEPIKPTAVAATKSGHATVAKITAGSTPKHEKTARSADAGKRSKGRTRVAKRIGGRARRAARP